mmetsp:Transcript_26147/g.84139  ORF Transcript_26147/g.84139 Transcript_26147/m.84139 type:complete len:326 (+) Transcript_26147:44-1021(+)
MTSLSAFPLHLLIDIAALVSPKDRSSMRVVARRFRIAVAELRLARLRRPETAAPIHARNAIHAIHALRKALDDTVEKARTSLAKRVLFGLDTFTPPDVLPQELGELSRVLDAITTHEVLGKGEVGVSPEEALSILRSMSDEELRDTWWLHRPGIRALADSLRVSAHRADNRESKNYGGWWDTRRHVVVPFWFVRSSGEKSPTYYVVLFERFPEHDPDDVKERHLGIVTSDTKTPKHSIRDRFHHCEGLIDGEVGSLVCWGENGRHDGTTYFDEDSVKTWAKSALTGTPAQGWTDGVVLLRLVVSVTLCGDLGDDPLGGFLEYRHS